MRRGGAGGGDVTARGLVVCCVVACGTRRRGDGRDVGVGLARSRAWGGRFGDITHAGSRVMRAMRAPFGFGFGGSVTHGAAAAADTNAQRRGRDRESKRATGGVRRASAGWPAGADAPSFKWPLRSPPHGKSGERRQLVCDSARHEGAETAVFCFSASVPWGLFKSTWSFFCVVLGRPGPSSCVYFNAKLAGTRRTVKPDVS